MGTIKELRWWAYKILPLAYDDSLSYYEVLSKATQKLNEVIDTTNKLPKAISEEIKNQLSGEDTDLYDNLFAGIVNAIATKEADEITFTPSDKQGGEVIWLGNTLYEVITPMVAGTNYIIGTNIVPVDVESELRKIKEYICTHNEYFRQRAEQNHDTQTYLYWKDNLYRVDADIKADDILAERTTVNGVTTGQLTLVNTMDEVTAHYIEMHEADNNLQTQIDGNDGDIEALQKEDVNLQKQITQNDTNINNRVSNIVAQAGSDNTEIVDGRKWAEKFGEITSNTIGDAIREQITRSLNYLGEINDGDNLDDYKEAGWYGVKSYHMFYSILHELNYPVSDSEFLNGTLYVIKGIGGSYQYVEQIYTSLTHPYAISRILSGSGWEKWTYFCGANDPNSLNSLFRYSETDSTKFLPNKMFIPAQGTEGLPYNGDGYYIVTIEFHSSILQIAKPVYDNGNILSSTFYRTIVDGKVFNDWTNNTFLNETLTKDFYNGLIKDFHALYAGGVAKGDYEDAPFTSNWYFVNIPFTIKATIGNYQFAWDEKGHQKLRFVFTVGDKVYNDKWIETGELAGRNIHLVTLGDSITAGCYSTSDGKTVQVHDGIYAYSRVIEAHYNCTVTNLGVGGATISSILTNQVPLIPDDADIITITGGTNDYVGGFTAPLGTPNDTDANTLCGRFYVMTKEAMEKAPNARIILISPWIINPGDYTTIDTQYSYLATKNNFNFKELDEALEQLAQNMHIEFISGVKGAPINIFNITHTLYDGVHPSIEAYKAIGNWLGSKIF